MSLKQKTIAGAFWVVSERFTLQGIQFIISIMLARILMPEEFGLIGMITIFLAIAQSLTDSGLASSLIRTKDPDQVDYSTVFVFNIGGSIIIYGLVFLLAPLIAQFYERGILTGLIRVLGLMIITNSLGSVQNAQFTRSMDFRTLFIIQIPAVVISGIVGVMMAKNGYGVWSLVYMQLIGNVVTLVFLWLRSSWRPSFVFSMPRFKRHIAFGFNMTLSSILNSIFDDIYNIVVGKYFSATQLGYYTRANSLKQLPVSNIASAINKVTFPLFSQMQDDNLRLRLAYKKMMQQVTFWVAPVLIGMGVISYPLFRLMFTEKWLPSVPYFQLLVVVGIMYPLHGYNLSVLQVKGRSDLVLRLEIIKKIIIVISVVVAIPYGIYGLLYSQIVLTFLIFFINSYYTGRFINYYVIEQVRDLLPVIALAVSMGALCYFADSLIVLWPDVLRVTLIAFLGSVFYFFISYIIKLDPFFVFIDVLRDLKIKYDTRN